MSCVPLYLYVCKLSVGPMIGGVRFHAGSGTRNSGMVELQYNSVWLPVCDRYFYDLTADILCKELGFGYVERINWYFKGPIESDIKNTLYETAYCYS